MSKMGSDFDKENAANQVSLSALDSRSPDAPRIGAEELQALVEAFDGGFRAVGGESLESGIALAAKLLRLLLVWMEQMQTREDTLRILSQVQQPTSEEMQFIIGIAQSLPQLIAAGAKLLANDLAVEYPIQTGGRPKSLDRESRGALRSFIGQLYAEGVELRIAKKRAAQRFNVSLSTVNRAWAARKHPEREKPSIPEMIKFLTT